MPDDILLDVRHLKTSFFTSDGVVPAVDDVSYAIRRGRTLALVGESGCGKSVSALSIMRLIAPPGKIVAGEIVLGDQDLLELSDEEMASIRGRDLAMIFQEPMTALNPVFRVGDQITEAIRLHQHVDKRTAHRMAIDLFAQVGIPSPRERLEAYPHEMSGGMRQRVMIAMAISCSPKLLIADEPTTALDVTIQAQILELLRRLKAEQGMALLMITHDLGVVAEMAQDVSVMYAGKIIERADVLELYKNPLHPYTQGLLTSIPTLATDRSQALNVVKGTVPNPLHLPPGCPFAPRCPHAMPICWQEMPEHKRETSGHWVSCWLYDRSHGQQPGSAATPTAPGVAVAAAPVLVGAKADQEFAPQDRDAYLGSLTARRGGEPERADDANVVLGSQLSLEEYRVSVDQPETLLDDEAAQAADEQRARSNEQ